MQGSVESARTMAESGGGVAVVRLTTPEAHEDYLGLRQRESNILMRQSYARMDQNPDNV